MTLVLLVEDNKNLVDDLEISLSMADYQVVVAGNGVEAIKLLEKLEPLPDIIVSDVSMPQMDGFTLFETIRGNPVWMTIPFVFLTARDGEADLDRGYGLGADDYLVKPFQADHLLRVIHSKLKRQQMIKSQLVAQEAALERAKRELTQMVAHELRTPLVSINMVLDIISHQVNSLADDQLQDLLGILGSGSKRLNRVVEQMVLSTQLESGILSRKLILEQGFSAYIHDILIASVDVARRSAIRQSDNPIRIEAHDESALVLADTHSLRHALAEVICNALVFSPVGEEIIITQWLENEYIWISVADHGEGIATDKLDKVQQSFYQVNREVREQQGMGMGLWLTHRIVEAHGGSLTIRSTPGQGTQAIIGLPVSKQELNMPFRA